MLSMELRAVFFYVIINCLNVCRAQEGLMPSQPHVWQEALLPSVCSKDANGTSLSVEIRLPFMDMELRHEHHFLVLQEQQGQLLLTLHGRELFQMQLAGQDKRLVRLGELTGRVRHLVAKRAAVVSWREYILLAVALEDYLEVYQISLKYLLDAAQFQFDPIQEFALPGKLQQLKLLKPNQGQEQEQVLLLLITEYTKSQAKCKTFEWSETYFNPLEELNLPAIKAFQMVGRQPQYLITGRALRGQTRLVLTVHELETPSLRLLVRQSLTVHARHVQAVRFRGRNWLYACRSDTSNSSCLPFRMVEGNFVLYRKLVLNQLHFKHLAAWERGRMLAGARSNGEVLVFNTARLDCYSGFMADANPSGLYTHRNAQNESFLLLTYQRDPSTTLLRMVQVGGANDSGSLSASLEGNDDLSSVQQHRFEFEETINALRSLLLRRKEQLDALRELTAPQKQLKLSLQQPLRMRSGGRVEHVHLRGKHLSTPTQLRQRMEQLRRHYAVNRRPVRSFGVGNTTSADQDVLKVKHLHVQNLIYHGKLLPGHNLDIAEATPLLTIKGQLVTKTLNTKQLLTPQSYKRPSRSFDPQQLANNTVVRHLQVARINNLSWFDFYDELFLHSRDNEIEGRLIVQSRARVVNLQTTLLNGLVVQQLFNLRQPQLISSNIYMSAFFVQKLDVKLLNGLNFNEDIVFRGNNHTLIKTPVRFNEISISGTLVVANSTKWTRQMPEESLSGQMQQYYTKQVIITGSLTVDNLKLDTKATKMRLANGQSLKKEDLHKNYLLLNEPQNLTELLFGNAKITTNTLNTNYIEGHPMDQHLLSGAGQRAVPGHMPLHIIVMNASIEGDVYCRNHSSGLAQLSREAVRHGERANITGDKHFVKIVRIDTLESDSLNGIAVQDLVLKSQLTQNFTDRKIFLRIVVKQNLDIKLNLNAQQLNRLHVSQLLAPTYSLQRLELLDTPKLEQLIFQRLNGLPFDELLSKLSVGNSQQLLLHKQLIIEGNVRFERELQLQTVNGIHWNDYVKRLVNANTNSVITSRKIFEDLVVVTDALHVPSINGLNLSVLLDNTLLRTMPQVITGDYTFGRMLVSNLDVPSINGEPTKSFLDTRQSTLELRDLNVEQIIINGSFGCHLAHDPLPNLSAQLKALQQRAWPNLVVLGDALWPDAEATTASAQNLDYLRHHAVRRRGGTQIISGHVILNKPDLGNIQTRALFPQQLNMSHIASDALLRHGPGLQVVTAAQDMFQPVSVRNLILLKDCQFGLLNNIDPIRLNASLYRRSSGLPIAAELRFMTPPALDKLLLQGQFNGCQLDSIFEQSKGTKWPAVRFRQLHLQQSLQVSEINGMNLEYLLMQRVPLRSEGPLELFGQLRFEHLVLGQRAMLRTINGISLQNVLYKHGQQTQTITGNKIFDGGIELQGPVHIMKLNGKDLSDSYQQSIFTNMDYNIDSLVLDAAVFQGGLLPDLQEPLLGAQLEQVNERQQLLEQLHQLEQQLRNKQSNSSKHLLYLDYEQQIFQPVWSAPAANATLDMHVALQPQPNSICQLREIHAQLSRSAQRVHLTNVSSLQSRLYVSSQEQPIHIKVHNYCNRQKFGSRIHFSCRNKVHTLGMHQQVEAVQLLERNSYTLLLLSTISELRVLRVNHTNCSLSDWQSLQPAAGRLMQLIEVAANTQLLLSSGLHEHMPVVAVHRLATQSQRFELLQHIPGDYDLAEQQDQQLLLSCYRCHHIAVHIFDEVAQRFAPVQQLRLQARIQQLLPFAVGHERHLLVLTLPGSNHFYLFSYTAIEGWQQRTYGQLGNVLWSWPLIKPRTELTASTSVLLLCGQQQCSLVRALLP